MTYTLARTPNPRRGAFMTRPHHRGELAPRDYRGMTREVGRMRSSVAPLVRSGRAFEAPDRMPMMVRGFEIPGDAGSADALALGFSLKPPKWVRKASVAIRRNVTIKRVGEVAAIGAGIALAPILLPAVGAGASFLARGALSAGGGVLSAGRGLLNLFGRPSLIGPPAPPSIPPSVDPNMITNPAASPPAPLMLPQTPGAIDMGPGPGPSSGGGGGGMSPAADLTDDSGAAPPPAPAGMGNNLALLALGAVALVMVSKAIRKGGR